MVGSSSYEVETTITCLWLFGELLGTRHVRKHEVEAFRGKSNLTQIVCGGFHCCALDSDGDLYTWGSATGDDQSNGDLLGHGTGADVATPTLVRALHDHGPVVHIAAASYQTSAVTAAGELFTWGDCDGNALGHGPQVTTDVPRQVDALRANPVLRASCGYTNEGVLTRNGELFLWGGGMWETQAGLRAEHPTQFDVVGLAEEGLAIADLVVGQRHSCLLVERKADADEEAGR
jgi:alpha-tubulin suppressor-like RCC1 family protein